MYKGILSSISVYMYFKSITEPRNITQLFIQFETVIEFGLLDVNWIDSFHILTSNSLPHEFTSMWYSYYIDENSNI